MIFARDNAFCHKAPIHQSSACNLHGRKQNPGFPLTDLCFFTIRKQIPSFPLTEFPFDPNSM